MLDPCSRVAGTAWLCGVTTAAGLCAAVIEPQAASTQARQNTNASDFSRTLNAFQATKHFSFVQVNGALNGIPYFGPKSAIIARPSSLQNDNLASKCLTGSTTSCYALNVPP